MAISQNVDLHTTVKIKDDFLCVEYQITNKTKSSLVFYKPTNEDFCNGILNISFRNNKGKDIIYNHCDEILHLDAITLNCRNIRILDEHESFIFSLKINKPSFLKEGYFVKCGINYEDIYFINDNETKRGTTVFAQDLITNYTTLSKE